MENTCVGVSFYINHGYKVAVLKKNSLLLLPFFMSVATYCYYEKLRRTMRTAIVSYHNTPPMFYNLFLQK